MDNYADHPDEWIAACHNPRLNSEALRKAYLALHNFSSDKNNSIGIRRCASGGLQYVAEHPNTDSDILDYLYDENKYVWMDAIVYNANASRHVLDDAMARNNNHLKAQIATNPKLPEDIAFTLYDTSTDDDIEIRYALAANLNTPKKILARLTLSKDSDISVVATHNLHL